MNFIQTILSSNVFSGLATVLTGAVAIIIYFQQKYDAKIQAARVLLMEIRAAEEGFDHVKELLDKGITLDLPTIFPTKNWKNYSHLFISDFDQDELKSIASFYEHGEIIEDFAKKNNNFFWVTTEERARVTTQMIAKIIIDVWADATIPDSEKGMEVAARRDNLNKNMDSYNSPYSPQKPINDIQEYLRKIKSLTTTSCGIKLKRLAKFK